MLPNCPITGHTAFSCAARCLKRQISCHYKRYIQLSQSGPCIGEVQTRHEYWNLYVTMLWLYHVVESSGCKHGGKRCSLLWQKRQNSSKISMDRLIKVDEKTSVSNIIHVSYIHTTLYGSAAGCRSIQKTCAFWKNGLTFENTQSQLTYFCKSNINQTFTNGNGMIWGVMIAIFTEIRHLVEELITFLYFFGPQKLSILTARLNKSLLISTSNSMRGD